MLVKSYDQTLAVQAFANPTTASQST